MNKQIFLITIFLLLNSCTPNATQNATATLVPTITSTPAPTITPTISPTATETPDPNMPPDATGKDAQGNYVKLDNSVIYTWTKVPYGGNPNNYIQEWTRVGTVDTSGILLIDKREGGFVSAINMQIFLLDNISQFGRFILIDHPDPSPTMNNPGILSGFSGALTADLFRKALGIKQGMDWYNALQDLANGNPDGKLNVTFTTRGGVKHTWNPIAGYKFYQVSATNSDPKNHPEYDESKDDYFPGVIFRTNITTDQATNELIGSGSIVSDKPVTDEQIIKLMLIVLAKAASGTASDDIQYTPHFAEIC